MPSASGNRIRRRRAQFLADRYLSAGEEPRRRRRGARFSAEVFGDGPVSSLSVWLAAALFVLTCGVVAALAYFSVRADSDLRAYEHAPTCDPSTATSLVCREEVPVTVTDVGETGGKSSIDYVEVSGLLLPQTQMRIELVDRSPVWPIVAPGDDATVELWHGRPTAITDNYVTGEARKSPRAHLVLVAAYTLVAIAGAGLTAVFWLRVAFARRYGRGSWRQLFQLPLLRPTALLVMIGFVAAAAFGIHFESIVTTIIADGLITLVAVAALAMRWWLVRRRRT